MVSMLLLLLTLSYLIGSSSSVVRANKLLSNEESGMNRLNSFIGDLQSKWIENLSILSQFTEKDQSGLFSLRRQLNIEEWDELNKVLQNTVISLPFDFEYEDKFASFIDLKFTGSNLKCFNLNVGDIVVSYTQASDQRLIFNIEIVDLELDCTLDFTYDSLWNGDGTAIVNTGKNGASFELEFMSKSFLVSPPTNSTFTDCGVALDVQDLDFTGGLDSRIFNAIDKPLRNVIETQVGGVACKELASSGSSFVNTILTNTTEMLEPFSQSAAADPISAENELVVPNNVDVLNLRDKDDGVGYLLQLVQGEIRSLLDEVEDLNSPTGTGYDLGINLFMRQNLLDEDRSLLLPVDEILPGGLVIVEGHTEFEDVIIRLDQLRIFGLDTFTNLELFETIGNFTLRNKLSMDFLNFELDVTIDVKLHSDEDAIFTASDDTRITETVKVQFGIDKLDAAISTLLGVDYNQLKNLQFGHLMNIQNLLPCILSTMFKAKLTELYVDFGNIREPSIKGFISPGFDRILNESINAMLLMYKPAILKAMPGLFQTKVNGLINENIIDSYLSDSENTKCKLPDGTGEFVDFRDLLLPSEAAATLGGTGSTPYGDLIPFIFKLAEEKLFEVDPVSGMSSLNKLLVEPLTKSQSNVSGTILFPGDILNTTANVEIGNLNTEVELKLYNARIENMNTIGKPFELLQPISNDPYSLSNTVGFGVGPEPLRFAGTFVVNMLDDGLNVQNEMEVSLDVKSATTIIGIYLKIMEDPLLSFPIRDILNPHCWMATIPPPPLDIYGMPVSKSDLTATLKDIAVSFASLQLNVTCTSCTSPTLQAFAELASSAEAIEDMTFVGNRVLDFATGLLDGNLLDAEISRMLHEAPRKCPHSPKYVGPNPPSLEYEPFEAIEQSGDESAKFLIAIAIVAVCVGVLLSIILLITRCIVRRRHRKWLQTLTNKEIFDIYQEQSKKAKINLLTKAMFTSPCVPWYVRYSMPVIILGNIALFLSGHLSLGGSVSIVANLFGETLVVDNFFEFSIARSTVDIWNADGKVLAILIVLFSGVWPYSKQLITLALWFLPPKTVSSSLRGNIFIWLDFLAKWSMLDIFVLIFTVVAFRVNVDSPKFAFLPENLYSLDLMVVPLWGLYSNMTAQLISQFSSHFIIHYHRKIVQAAAKQFDTQERQQNDDTITEVCSGDSNDVDSTSSEDQEQVNQQSAEVLRKHYFFRPHRIEDDSDRLQVRRYVDHVVMLVGLAITVLVVFGCIYPSFSIEVLGIIGIVVESGQQFEQAEYKYNIFGIVKLLMEEASVLDSAGHYIGLGIFSFILVATTLFVPLAQTIILIRQWFLPIKGTRSRGRTLVLLEILQAWQYMEVYVIALIVSAWQLGPISEFMVNEYCNEFTNAFASFVFYGLIDADDAQCFQVTVNVLSGTYAFIISALLLALLNTFVVKAMNQYIVDKNRSNSSSADRRPDLSSSSYDIHRKISCDDYSIEDGNDTNIDSEIIDTVKPVPVMFTDKFRWALVKHKKDKDNDDQRTSNDNTTRIPATCDPEVSMETTENNLTTIPINP